MASKQEKLAAARKKLKEFQVKNKDGDPSKQKSTPNASPSILTSNPTVYNSPVISNNENQINNSMPNYGFQSLQATINTTTGMDKKTPDSTVFRPVYDNIEQSVNGSKIPKEPNFDSANGLEGNTIRFEGKNYFDSSAFSNSIPKESVVLEAKSENSSYSSGDKITTKEAGKEAFDVSHNKSLNDVIQPLQLELQNHAQTIAILVQQRNEAQNALDETQKWFAKVTEEAQELKQQTAVLSSSNNSLNQKLSDAEGVIMKLKLEKEDNRMKLEELDSLKDSYQVKLDGVEEQLQEMRRKYEEKNVNCQQLLHNLHEVQSQLSFYQIQLQQYSAEGHSNLAVQVSELQNENLGLKQKVSELEKKLETESAEKEESSQKFHVYAQQCNSQLASLNSEVKSLKLDNENLKQKNEILSKNLSEIESSKTDETTPKDSLEGEIADLHDQLSALTEKYNELEVTCKKKEEECSRFQSESEEKEFQLNKLLKDLNELENENRRLAQEAETPKANERLLATMESDKVAAARAMSQNQKLKEQIAEFETTFIKLNEEKLELTNQLAHEKHINTELQNLLNKAKHHGEGENHQHRHDDECHHDSESPEPLVNDSNEIEELRNIIRQLQDDKVELTARLSSYEINKKTEEKAKPLAKECDHDHNHQHDHHHDHGHEHNHEDSNCEDTKLLLQQMEEKVRKTMNEIAKLDEEKEKLEHLVLQLQGETETIGEYITLYQKQRMILRQRAQQKDIQLMQLSKDKEELKSKLAALDDLVQHLIAERENISTQPGAKLPALNPTGDVAENTAGKIRALISEIGSTTLIDNQSIAFEHCSCCSGRLITI